MWNYKIAMAASIRLSAEMASRFWNVMNEDVRVLKDALKIVNQERAFQEGFYQVFCYRPKFQRIFFSYWYWWFAKRRKKNITSGNRSYESHFHAFLGIWSWCACLFSLTLTVEIWLYLTLRLRCIKKISAKAYLERKVLLKIVTNSFPKKYTSSFKYIKRTEVSWEVDTLYVFRSQQDKTQVIMKLSPNFTSIPFANLLTCWKTNQGHPTRLVLLYQVKLSYCQAKRLCQTKHHSAAFLANKPRCELSGIRKKKETLLHPGYYNPWECRTEPHKTKQSRNHHIHSKYVLW